MAATFRFGRMIARHRAAFAAIAGVLAALAAVLVPEWRLVALVEALHLADLVPAARPPLGMTARGLLALVAGGGAGLAVWTGLALVGRAAAPRQRDEGDAPAMPVIRRADAHPDAPARRPIRAHEDLGEPLPIAGSIRARAPAAPIGPELSLPRDLDTPLAAIDPGAIPDVPRDPVRPVPPLAPAPTEAPAEVFRLTPVRRAARPAPVPAAAAEAAPAESDQEAAPAAMPVRAAANDALVPAEAEVASASISALVERLERGAAHRRERPRALADDTLGMLRGLAAR